MIERGVALMLMLLTAHSAEEKNNRSTHVPHQFLKSVSVTHETVHDLKRRVDFILIL